KHQEPLHGWQRAIVAPRDFQKLFVTRKGRGEREALIVRENRKSIRRVIAPGSESRRLIKPGDLGSLFARFKPGKEPMPQARQRSLFLVAPREVAILTVKFLRNNFQRAKNRDQRRRDKFSGHLRILDI